jgi:WD40 repeat protein
MEMAGPKPISAMAFHPDGTALVLASGKVIRYWDARTAKLNGPAVSHDEEIVSMAFSGDGRYLVVAGQRMVGIRSYQDGVLVHSHHVGMPVFALAFSRSGDHIMAGPSLGQMDGRVWCSRSGNSRPSAGRLFSSNFAATRAGDGPWLVVRGQDKSLRVYDGKTLRSIGSAIMPSDDVRLGDARCFGVSRKMEAEWSA